MNAVVVPGDFDDRTHVLRGRPEHRGALASVLVGVQGRWLNQHPGHDRATRRLWPALALPGTLWLIALFLVPIYAVMAVAFSGNINLFGEPIPAWNPLDWQFATFNQVISDSLSGPYRAVWIRTAIYTFCALVICVAVGYPVAYYTARLAGKRRGLVLALILAPWWINYITRMLAWVNLLQDDGYVNKADRDLRRRAGLLAGRQRRSPS